MMMEMVVMVVMVVMVMVVKIMMMHFFQGICSIWSKKQWWALQMHFVPPRFFLWNCFSPAQIQEETHENNMVFERGLVCKVLFSTIILVFW